MRHARAVIRLLSVSVATLAIYVLYVAARLPLRLFHCRREAWRNKCTRIWLVTVAAILSLKITVSGSAPKPPFFLVSNHLSYIDVVVMYSLLDCTFIVKNDVRRWPVIGFMIKTMDVLFIDRNRRVDVKRVNSLISKALNSYQGMILFPEGTTSQGDCVRPFRASLLKQPAVKGIAVHSAAIAYRTEGGDLTASESVCWHGDISFFAHIYRLSGNRRIHCMLAFGGAIKDNERKSLSVKLHKEVQCIYSALTETDKRAGTAY
ncbi:MAG: lysophospholipid acyltransferase family protein [Balneolaceae bacterium]